jgi:HK97 family phage portal protein
MFDRLIRNVANSIVKRSSILDATSDGFALRMWGVPTMAGPQISEANALGITAIWRCVRLYADTIASLPFYTAKRDTRGGSKKAVNHWSYDLVSSKPNRSMTSASFTQAIIGHALTYGNGYAQIQWDQGNKTASELTLLDPTSIQPRFDPDRGILYRHTPTKQDLFPEDVIHIHGFGWDGVSGYSPISISRETLGTFVAKNVWESSLYANSAQAAGHIEVPGDMSRKQQEDLRNQWDDIHGGPEKAGKIGILKGGAKWVQTAFSPEDAQLILSKGFSIAEIARIYSVPLHFLNVMEGATVGNMEEMALQFLTFSLLPWLTMICQEYDAKLFSDSERSRYFTTHDLDVLTRGNMTARIAYNKGMFSMGGLSVNEIRLREGENPIDDPRFDYHWIPTNNLTPVELFGKETATQPDVSKPSAPDPVPPDPEPDPSDPAEPAEAEPEEVAKN